MTTEEPQDSPLFSLDDGPEPVWILQARDGTKVLFDPDPLATHAWTDLLVMKSDLAEMSEDTPGEEILKRLHTILGKFCVDDDSRKAWKRSLPDLGLKKTLGLMKVYAEAVQGEEGLPT